MVRKRDDVKFMVELSMILVFHSVTSTSAFTRMTRP